MTDHPLSQRLSELRIPPGYRVTIHLGEKPERAFPERPRAFGPPVPDGYDVPDAGSKIPEPTARIDIFHHGRAISSAEIRQEDLDTVAELLEMVLDGKDDDGLRRLVEVYCTKCGFNLMENVDTGAKVPMIVRMTPSQIAEVESPDATCGVCGGQMAVRDVAEPPKPETKVYEFKPREK